MRRTPSPTLLGDTKSTQSGGLTDAEVSGRYDEHQSSTLLGDTKSTLSGGLKRMTRMREGGKKCICMRKKKQLTYETDRIARTVRKREGGKKRIMGQK